VSHRRHTECQCQCQPRTNGAAPSLLAGLVRDLDVDDDDVVDVVDVDVVDVAVAVARRLAGGSSSIEASERLPSSGRGVTRACCALLYASLSTDDAGA